MNPMNHKVLQSFLLLASTHQFLDNRYVTKGEELRLTVRCLDQNGEVSTNFFHVSVFFVGLTDVAETCIWSATLKGWTPDGSLCQFHLAPKHVTCYSNRFLLVLVCLWRMFICLYIYIYIYDHYVIDTQKKVEFVFSKSIFELFFWGTFGRLKCAQLSKLRGCEFIHCQRCSLSYYSYSRCGDLWTRLVRRRLHSDALWHLSGENIQRSHWWLRG